MLIAFELSMPRNNSWNGRWSGQEKVYAKVRSVTAQKAILKYSTLIGRHYYNFGDGWTAAVEVKVVDSNTARRLRAKSAGFCGYDWMIESLIDHGQMTA